MAKYELHTFDVLRNETDGYEINNEFRSGEIYEIPDDVDDETVIQLLRKEGVFRKGIRRSRIDIEWEESGWFFRDARNGKPEFRLQRVRDISWAV